MRIAIPIIAAAVALSAAGCGSTVEGTATPDRFVPSFDNPDPSVRIEGIVIVEPPAGLHVRPTQRVDYDLVPPVGGPHDAVWAACNGLVYPTAVRTESIVHSLEHGAVWIAYDPDRVRGADLDRLAERVEGRSYLLMSPYPGLPVPISLQSWGHQLPVDSVDDPRIDRFVTALRLNPATFPEPGATCSTLPGRFDPDDPPPFDPSPVDPDDPDTVPVR
ncbi:DUF3105 domain-containing protein [Rhodococcus sp. NPDC058505]|uniref:DUF3105 domain-containing protein n=1 Tax=Rhodococcus sp. NPDC058505 TaxID=3346531 RepID=UPI00364EB121